MTDITMLERQKEREAGWVKSGSDRFQRHLENSSGGPSSASRAILARAAGTLETVLQHRMVLSGVGRSTDILTPVIAVLGEAHLAAITVTGVLQSLGRSRFDNPGVSTSVLDFGAVLGEAVEHDIRFRAWAKGAEKYALARMRKEMKGNPQTWRRRAKALREVGTEPWSRDSTRLVGVELIACLEKAAPDVFETFVLRHGSRTVRHLRMTERACEDTNDAAAKAAVSTPRYGMMLVPPMPWRYQEKTQ